MTQIQEELLTAAEEAAQLSYSPYSKFTVGAAVYADGRIFQGANIENASSNLGICAERVSIAHARMHNATTIEGIALYCLDPKKGSQGSLVENQCLPCGACLQWISELAPDAWIITNSSKRVYSLSDLLPKPFTLRD
jgi:cytidine deaminase